MVPGALGGFAGRTGRTLDKDVREVAVLMMEERSDDEVMVEVSELRFDDGGRVREGGGGGGGFVCVGRTAYGTGTEPDADAGTLDAGMGVGGAVDDFRGRCGSLGGSGRRTYSAQSFDRDETLGLTTEDAETFSNDSSKLTLLTLSCSWPFSVSRSSRSTG